MENFQEEIEGFVSHFDEQTRHAIGLMKMHQVINYSPEVDSLFDQTQVAWGYAKIQQSLLFELVLVLCRFYDAGDRSKSFPTIFNHEAVGSQPHAWFSGLPQRQRDLFSQAKNKWLEVKGGHLLSVTKILRNKFWAHTDIQAQEILSKEKIAENPEAGSKNLQRPKYGYVDNLCAETQKIVEGLVQSILNRDPNFEDAEQVWGQHAQLFFDMLKMGKKALDEDRTQRLAQLGGTEKALAGIPRRQMK